MTRITLKDAVTDLEVVMAEIDDAAEITDALLTRFEAGRNSVAEKVDGWILYLDSLKGMQAALKERHERVRDALKKTEALQKRLREYVAFQLASHPSVPFKGTEGSLYLRKNPGALKISYDLPDKTVYGVVPHEIVGREPSMLPYLDSIEFVILNKEKLKADIEAGMVFPWAKIEQGAHVRIKG